MATVKPFRALRPKPELASQVVELPYDVMSTEEAREMALNRPLSFLRVSKPEIELPADTDPYSPKVYEHGASNFRKLIQDGVLVRDTEPYFYLYRQQMGQHVQTGIVGASSVVDYEKNIIKKHEFTRPDKEDDRVRHIDVLNSQTGPVFLTYRSRPTLEALIQKLTAGKPDVDVTAADGIRHSAWVVRDQAANTQIEAEFAAMPELYICDGHHRSAAAARVAQARRKSNPSAKGDASHEFFLTVIFPEKEMKILPYNRLLTDLNGLTEQEFFKQLEKHFKVTPHASKSPRARHEVSCYLAGKWHTLTAKPEFVDESNPIERLDVSLLQRYVLDPILGIKDPRRDKRIQFSGGIRGPEELEKLVNAKEFAVAFSMFPTSIQDLMAIADAGAVMPPKSTWFEPKLRDAMFCHVLD